MELLMLNGKKFYFITSANRVEKWFKDRFRQLKAEQRIP